MTPAYLLAVLTLITAQPLALLSMTLAALAWLHVAIPAGYLVYRALGGQWDGVGWFYGVLCVVHGWRVGMLGARETRRVGELAEGWEA